MNRDALLERDKTSLSGATCDQGIHLEFNCAEPRVMTFELQVESNHRPLGAVNLFSLTASAHTLLTDSTYKTHLWKAHLSFR